MLYALGVFRWFQNWLRYRGYSRCPDCLKARYVLGFQVGNHKDCMEF
jgi:hypothetical protein